MSGEELGNEGLDVIDGEDEVFGGEGLVGLDGLDTLGDNELLALYRGGRDTGRGRNAATVLISRYLKLVSKRARAYSGGAAEFDDLAQEGFLAFLRAAETFEPKRGSAFAAFADVCVTNGIRSAVRRLSRGAEGLGAVEDLQEERGTEDAYTPENIWVEKEAEAGLYEKISELLSKKEWDIFKLYVGGAPCGEIAEKLGIPKKSVENAVFRIRKKLKTLFSYGDRA